MNNWPTYEQWADAAISIGSREQPDFCRDTYELPNKNHVCVDAIMPRSIWKEGYTLVFLPSIQLPITTELPSGGQMMEGYGEQGTGFPQWIEYEECLDPLKVAYEYAKHLADPCP